MNPEVHVHRGRWKEILELGSQLKKVLWKGKREQWNGWEGPIGQDALKKKVAETSLIGGLSGRRVGARRRSDQLGLYELEALGAESFSVTS